MSHITLLGGLYYPRSVFLKPTSGHITIGSCSQTNSSMTDLSVLYSKVNDLWLLYTSYIIIVLWPSLWPKHITTKLPNGFQDNLHPMIFSLMVSTMYLTSSSLTYGPAGRHIPTLNKASDTPLT